MSPIVRSGYSDGSERRERAKLYNSGAWRRTRKAVLERAGGRCEWCGTSEPPIDAVHLTRSTLALVRTGDPFNADDLAAGCRRCHSRYAAGKLGRPGR